MEGREWTAVNLGRIPCNLGCSYCSVEHGKGTGTKQPTDKDIRNLFDGPLRRKYGERPLLVQVFAETEPTLNQKAIRALDKIGTENENLRFILSTNGMNLDLIKQLAEHDWAFSVSYDGVEQGRNRLTQEEGDSGEIVRDSIEHIVSTKNPLLLRATVSDWNTFDYTAKEVVSLGCEFLEASDILGLGFGKGMSTVGDRYSIVSVAQEYFPDLHVFTPLTGRGYCPLAAGSGEYWVLNGEWDARSCFVDTNFKANQQDLQTRAREDGCLLDPIDRDWNDISQSDVLLGGRRAWQERLGIVHTSGGGCCFTDGGGCCL